MQRRDFLKLGAVAGAGAAASASGCASVGESLMATNLPMTTAEMDGLLSRLEAARGVISARDPFVGFLGLLPEAVRGQEKDPAVAKGIAALRKALRSLLLVGTFGDLPEEGRAYPGMQDLMWRSMAEMDEAMEGMTSAFANLTPTERADIGRALREDPDLALSILEALDAEAAQAGVPMNRRLHLRSIAFEATARLKQSAPLLIDEYLGKVEKINARHGSNEQLERQLAARMGEQAFFSMRQRTFANAARWRAADDGGGAVEGTLAPVPMPEPLLEPNADPDALNEGGGDKAAARARRLEGGRHASSKVLTAGGVLLGLGVIVGVGSALLVSTEFGFVIGVTAGALMFIGGLVMLIIGLVLRYRS